MQNLIKFHLFVHKITKGHNCVVNLQKWTPNNLNLDPVNITEYAKFGLILSIGSQDIEQKQVLSKMG